MKGAPLSCIRELEGIVLDYLSISERVTHEKQSNKYRCEAWSVWVGERLRHVLGGIWAL